MIFSVLRLISGIGIYDCVEELLRKEYTDEDKKSEERALQAKSRILKIMADLNVPQTCVLDELEVDCLHRLCPDLKNANEVTCNNYIEATQAYDAQEQNKQIVINEINARLDEIWSVEDDAACKALYLNTVFAFRNKYSVLLSASRRIAAPRRMNHMLRHCRSARKNN